MKPPTTDAQWKRKCMKRAEAEARKWNELKDAGFGDFPRDETEARELARFMAQVWEQPMGELVYAKIIDGRMWLYGNRECTEDQKYGEWTAAHPALAWNNACMYMHPLVVIR